MQTTHRNALLSVSGRKAMVEMVSIEKKTKVAAAEKYNLNSVTVKKWIERYVSEGESGPDAGYSHPHINPRAMPSKKVEEIITMRKGGKLTSDRIACKLKMYQRTASRHLIRAKLTRQKDMYDRDKEPPLHYEREALGDMFHLDIKKLRNFDEEGVRECSTGNRHKSANNVAASQYKQVSVDNLSRYASISIF